MTHLQRSAITTYCEQSLGLVTGDAAVMVTDAAPAQAAAAAMHAISIMLHHYTLAMLTLDQ